MKLRLFFILLNFSIAGLFAQQYGIRYGEKKRYTSYGITVNAMNYVGELDPGPSFIAPSIRYTRPSFGLVIVRRMKPALSYRGTFTYGRIKGDDYVSANSNGKNLPRKIRNLNFRNDIFELKGDLVFDFIGHNERYEKRHEYVPYGFIGLAVFYHNPSGQVPEGFDNAGKWVKLRPLKTEGRSYSTIQAAIPFGLGFRYKLAKNWDLAFEVGWRFTFTDYLDDVSKEYGDPMQMSDMGRLMAFKSAYVTAKDPEYQAYNPQPLLNAYDQPMLLPNGETLKTIQSYGGSYVLTEDGTQKKWESDDMRGDKNKDWYIVTGFHLTYIPPIKTVCPKFRY